jgi:hypothetical protein
VKVKHYRCSEYSATTWATCPADWDEELAQRNAKEAQKDYLAGLKLLADTQSDPPPLANNDRYHFPAAKYKGWNVDEALVDWEQKKEALKEWEAARTKAGQRFEQVLLNHGFGSLWSLDEDSVLTSEVIFAEIDWGHRHGMRLIYGSEAKDEWPSPKAMLAAIQDEEEW